MRIFLSRGKDAIGRGEIGEIGNIDRTVGAEFCCCDIAGIPPFGDFGHVERRVLPRRPIQGYAIRQSQLLLLPLERHRPGLRLTLKQDHPQHGRDAFRHFDSQKMRIGAGLCVVTAIRIAAISLYRGKCTGRCEYLAFRKLLFEVSAGFKAHQQCLQFHPRHRSDDGLAEELLPPAFGLLVPRDQIRVPQLAVITEVQNLIANPAVKHHRRIA